MLLYDYSYVPFSWDELEQQGHFCRTYVQELMGKRAFAKDARLSIYEREVIRAGVMLQRSFRLNDVIACLDKKESFCRKVVKSLVEKGLVLPAQPGLTRNHEFVVELTALQYIR